MHFQSAYLKLTLFYVLIVMLISVSFSVAIFNISSNDLENGLRRQTRILQDIPQGMMQPGTSFPNLEQIRADQLDQANNDMETNLIYFNLIILALSATASYFLAKKTLQPIKEMVERQNRFTADASHELRTPLTAMRTEIEVSLRDKGLNFNNAKNLLQSNLEEINKLENLSNMLLRLARYEENQIEISDEISLEDVVAEAYSRIEKSAIEKEIVFNNNFKDIKISGEQQSLVELFVTLLDNAIKYSPKKSTIHITIDYKKYNTAKSAQVIIQDHGMGIKASDLPYIFNRFYRSDTSRSKIKTDGYGLGLSIAQKIVELHKGSIKAESTPGKGSTFTVLLPVK
jgi:signal transduction histidine kinase